jgi:hypothetical protein
MTLKKPHSCPVPFRFLFLQLEKKVYRAALSSFKIILWKTTIKITVVLTYSLIARLIHTVEYCTQSYTLKQIVTVSGRIKNNYTTTLLTSYFIAGLVHRSTFAF